MAQFEAIYAEREGWKRPSRSYGKVDNKMHAEVTNGRTWGSSSLQIRGGLEEIAAFLWDFGSRSNMEISGDVERTFEKDAGGDR